MYANYYLVDVFVGVEFAQCALELCFLRVRGVVVEVVLLVGGVFVVGQLVLYE